MTLDRSLAALETAGLVRPVAKSPDTEYTFRHGLLQETAYGLLLNRERERLHLEVGVAFEQSYPERTKELAPLLGNHFLHGGDREKALQYLRMAGENARDRNANTEALDYFTDALEIADELDRPMEMADIRRERGLTHEIMGAFAAAQEDFEASLTLGREVGDPEIKWQALLDLGKLWAAKDYETTGGYFRDALALAREIDDPLVIARSLNRLGNWHINVGNPDRAKSRHQEALEVFEELDDQEGIAETLDFLGMSAMMSSDAKSGAEYYGQATQLLRSIGGKQRLASALITSGLMYGGTKTETIVSLDGTPEEALVELDEAMELARELGWRSGEAYALWTRSFVLNSLGRLDEAHESGRMSLDLAQEIKHVQWMTGAHCTLSRNCLEKRDLASALGHAELARKYAADIGSRHWSGIATALVGLVRLAADEFDQAERALMAFEAEDPAMEMLGDRMYWMARTELQLYAGRYGEALDLLDRLVESAPNYTKDEVIPRLFHNRGRAYMALNEYERARGQLEPAIAHCQRQGRRVLLWKLHGDLARLEILQTRTEAAEEQEAAGRSVVEEVAANLSDPEDRRRFRDWALERHSMDPLAGLPSGS